MRRRLWILMLACLLCLAGAWLLWQQPVKTQTKPSAPAKAAGPMAAASAASNLPTAVATNTATSAKTNQFACRLSNTSKTIDQLLGDRHAILLENALIDTSEPLNLSIPAHLRSKGDPGAYIVQARGPVDNAFRALLAAAGAEMVSYIPNNAYLVSIGKGGADGLAGNALVQAVIPYEPYYKIQLSMLPLAVQQKSLPEEAMLTLGLFPGTAQQTIKQIQGMGWPIMAQDNSPFGPIVRVIPPKNWAVLATLPGVQLIEPSRQRARANDLSRVTTGVSTDTQVSSNYMNLNGNNVLVEVNDTGIDAKHLDLVGRIIPDSALSLVDTNGHGTHVAGIIAGDGTESTTVTNASGSILPAVLGQFRGKAPLAHLYSVAAINNAFTALNFSDQYLQQAPALTNALISNNSWNYDGDGTYDLAAASYDAAVRDALPTVMGSQPVMFVFAAGNSGSGDDSGGSGNADTILSPATAKNVITVGALEQVRNITNIVTDINSNQSAVWQPQTDTSYQVARYSSRGNVGIGTEGQFGRFKPDVVAPGTFVLSTRSEQWDTNAYYNPTNDHVTVIADALPTNSMTDPPLEFFVYRNAAQVTLDAFELTTGSTNYPLPIFAWLGTDPNTTAPLLAGTNFASLPPAPNNVNWQVAVSNTSPALLIYELIADVLTTNDLGNQYQVLEGINDSIGSPNWYRYESGTSMASADVSGVLALIQDYFTNTLHATPSPALLKALVINGARVTSISYNLQVQNPINYEGWGLINLPDSLPPGITTNVAAPSESLLMIDQDSTKALATGDSHTFSVTLTSTNAQTLPLRVTLAWTDPPGDPAAAIKLVNDLNLVVTNLSVSTNPVVYYGNDIPAASVYNTPENSTNPPSYDSINNVENIYLAPGTGTNFSVTVQGYRVNVNAVTAHTNNVVQDFALVISCGDGTVTNAFTVTDQGLVSNPTSDQQVTVVTSTNMPLLNQFVGASTPLLGTNELSLGTNLMWSGTNGVLTVGMTNQWHFYVITNTGTNADFTNAAFVTFLPPTLSIPRMGVFAGSIPNATRPEADIDLYVAGPNDPNASGLTNLDPTVISNCLAGIDGDAVSLGRGGTEFVAYSNSAPGQVYYVGVYSEDQEASEYAFMPIFTDIPFSQPGPNGSQIVNGVLLPVNISDGSAAHPSAVYVFALALNPMQIGRIVVTNTIFSQNLGDLIGTLTHSQQTGLSAGVVLNNHDSPSPSGINQFIYDDSGRGDIIGSQPSDGPGSLNDFVGQQAVGPWILTEVDDAPAQNGAVNLFNLWIQPNQDLTKGVSGTIAGGSWFYGFIDVPPGTTNLSLFATNTTIPSEPIFLFVNTNAVPTLTNFIAMTGLTNPGPTGLQGGSISLGPPLDPGRYWVGIWNPNLTPQNFYLIATLGLGIAPQTTYTSAGPVPILDDAVTTDSMFVSADQTISSMEVGLRVDHPRVSDLVFHLISPDGTRCLLVENRGGTTTSGMGVTLTITNIIPVTSTGDGSPSTNVIDTGQTSGTLQIRYNFYTVPDELVVQYQGTNAFDSGIVSGSGVFNVTYGPGASTQVVIVMNPNVNPGPGDLWDYTVNAAQANYLYLVLTENTNLTTTPIKFAPTPFVPMLTNLSLAGAGWTNWPASAGGNDHWYLAATNSTGNPLDWDQADQIAHSQGGYLATITSAAENSFVFGLIDTPSFFDGVGNNGSGPAIGGIKTNSASLPGSDWTWETGEPWGYTNWAAGQPDFSSETRLQYWSGTQGVPTPTWNNLATNDTNLGGYVIERGPVMSGSNLYYLPEQSLDTYAGMNSLGQWQLEVQDNRVGATNPAPTLVSWQLHFIFTEPVPTIPTLTNGIPQTNTIPGGGIQYYVVNVPFNADMSTNALLLTAGQLNLLFDQSTPPTGTTPPDYLILSVNGVSGSAVLTTASSPTNIVPGGLYFLAVQNTGTTPVSYGIEVTFHFLGTSPVLPSIPEQIVAVGQQLVVTNTATDSNPGTLDYTLTTTVTNAPFPGIDTNGIITWTPVTNQAPAVYTFTTVVTNSSTGLSATNSFNVLVVLTNGLPAFPGAEGAGGFAIGGRGGDVYHVINLNDSGPGSLRYGVQTTTGNRTIVFDVSGAINLLSELRINKPYLTVAGQTAPGDGIAIQGLTTSVENSHDMQVRFLRCRPGDIYTPAFQDDSFHFRYVTNSIADHLSASWSIDEVLSTTLSTNVTVQWSVIAEPLDHSGHLMDSGAPGFQEHGFGSLLRYGYGAVSYHHNLYADNFSRNPRPGDNLRLDFINNVVSGWGAQAGYNEDDTDPILNPGGYTNFLNYVGNYFIAGSKSANPGIAFQANVPDPTFTQIYQSTNFIDNNPFTNVLNGSDTGVLMFVGTYTQLGSPTPMPEIPVTVTNPPLAYEQVLDFAGASVAGASSFGTSLLRDPVDTNVVTGVRNKSGQIIDFISSNSFAGVYLDTNFGVTYSGNTGPATYWQGQGLTTFVGVNPWPLLNPAPQPLDSDRDGIPDYWEITLARLGFTSMDPAVPNNNHSNPDGYTDLEHYINWLAAPHALTVSNTPVDVDLYAIAGRSGNLAFSVANPTNGSVTLTNAIATFAPSNGFSGFASFDFNVSNLDTAVSFGPVTVSVMVSVTNITTSSMLLTNAVPQTNTVPVGGIAYYLVNVPTNADLATNILVAADLPVNLLFSQVGFPTGTNTGDYTLLAASTGGSSLLGTTTAPTNIVPGGTYYLGVQNPNGAPATFTIEVDFHFLSSTNPPPPSITITSITYTNNGVTNGFLLQWQGPTNFQYEIQWTTNIAPLVLWSTVLNPVINVVVTATNGHYSFFDDGTLTGGFGPVKFYRILGGPDLGSVGPGPSTNLVLAGTTSQTVVPVPANALWASNVLISATGPLNVWFNPTNPPAGNTNAGDFLMLSATNAGVFVLTTNSVPPLVPGTNYFLGFQNPGTSNVTFVFQVTFGLAAVPISSITLTTNGLFQLQWSAPTNYQFQVEWTTNIAPLVAWTTNAAFVTSTNGTFTFVDTNAPSALKFYRLLEYP